MFEQHPVPQNISSYQFRLVGDMTLTQFFQLAGGALLGLLVYSLPLPNIFKWPLIIILVLGGAAMAFLPIQERPLAMWLGAFMRSIYSPTVYIWKKLPSYQFYALEDTTNAQSVAQDQQQTVQSETVAASPAHVANLEEGEKTMLTKISRLFALGGVRQPKNQQPAAVVNQQQTAQTQTVPAPVETQIPIATPPQKPIELPVAPAKKEVVVPQQQKVKVESHENNQQNENNIDHVPVEIEEQKLNKTLSADNQQQQTVAADFSVNAAPPTPPERANVVVGQVIDTSGKIVEGAILEIKDEQGRPVRALKTNKAGHFLIVTPLNNGKYTITTEKEGYNFDTIEIEAKDEKIEPIAIHAK